MTNEAKRAIEWLELEIQMHEELSAKWLGDLATERKELITSYFRLAITAINQREAAIAECKNSLSEADASCKDDCLVDLAVRILEILEVKS